MIRHLRSRLSISQFSGPVQISSASFLPAFAPSSTTHFHITTATFIAIARVSWLYIFTCIT
jgi:hypothetical protein